MVAVFSGETQAADLEELKKTLALPYPIVLDPQWKLYSAFGIVARPTVWIVDRSGTGRFEIAGYHRDLQTIVRADVDFLAGRINEEERKARATPQAAPSFAGTAGASVRYRLAKRLLEAGKRQAAKRQFELAWQEDPPSARAGVELARMLLEDGKVSEALSILDKALPMIPSDPLALGTKGLALLEQGRKEDAVRLLEQAVESGSSEPVFFYRLGRELEDRGETGKACRYFRRGFEILLERSGEQVR